MRPALLTAALLGIEEIMGCEAGPDMGGAVVRDSADVVIVDHGPVDVRSQARWALAGEPTVTRMKREEWDVFAGAQSGKPAGCLNVSTSQMERVEVLLASVLPGSDIDAVGP